MDGVRAGRRSKPQRSRADATKSALDDCLTIVLPRAENALPPVWLDLLAYPGGLKTVVRAMTSQLAAVRISRWRSTSSTVLSKRRMHSSARLR